MNVIFKCEPYYLKYNTIHVKYVTILWLLKHVGGAILIQIGSAM
jgi:hypothetical protein